MVRVAILGDGPAADAHARALRALAQEAVLVADPADAQVALAATPDDARRALLAGLDVLVEPCGADELRDVQAAAARGGAQPILGVACDALCDPTLRTLRRLVGDGPVIAVQTTHLEPFDDAPGHPDVTSDLLLGSLQAVLGIAGRPPAATQAAGRRVHRGQGLDFATATLCFDDDLVATITVGRAGARRVHEVVMETPTARVTADLAARTVAAERDLPGRGVVVEHLDVTGPDARTAHLASFLRSCRDRRPADVGVGVALGLLDVAEAVRKRVALVAHRPAARPPLRAA